LKRHTRLQQANEETISTEKQKQKDINLKNMISIIKWILFTIFIFSTFATDSEMENSSESRAIISTLNFFAEMGDEENVKLMLNILCNKKSGKLIQFLMTGDGQNMTALLYAAANGHVKIVKLFLDVFS